MANDGGSIDDESAAGKPRPPGIGRVVLVVLEPIDEVLWRRTPNPNVP
jgi:hypothetical protein